jgi:putative peptidoglycan lipid II flippase
MVGLVVHTMSDPTSSATRQKRFLRSFLASVFGTGASRILGGVRDVVLSNFLGAGKQSDAFFIAFTVPTVFRRFVADEGLTGALIPALAQAEKDGDVNAKTLANTTLSALLLANLGLCVLGVLGAEWLVKAFAYSFTDDPEQFALTVTLTRWLFPFVGMVSVVSFLEGLLNHKQHFFIPKLAPGLVSAGIVASVLWGASSFQQPVYALVVGVLGGGLAHVLINLPVVATRWGRVGLSFGFNEPRFRRLVRELLKVVAIGLMAQINILLLRQLATSVGDGAVTHYWNANRLVDLSQGMIAVAIGSALLPNLAEAVAEKDWPNFRQDLARAIALAAFVLIPVAACLTTFGLPLAAMMFRHGEYTWADVQLTGHTLQVMTPFLLSVAGINIVKKVYYALEDRNTLFAVGALGVILTGGLGFLLLPEYGVVGLGMALSLSTVVQFAAYLVVLWKRMKENLGLSLWGVPLLKVSVASVPAASVLVWFSAHGDWSQGPSLLQNWLALGLGSLLAIGLYLGLCLVLGVKEMPKGRT